MDANFDTNFDTKTDINFDFITDIDMNTDIFIDAITDTTAYTEEKSVIVICKDERVWEVYAVCPPEKLI